MTAPRVLRRQLRHALQERSHIAALHNGIRSEGAVRKTSRDPAMSKPQDVVTVRGRLIDIGERWVVASARHPAQRAVNTRHLTETPQERGHVAAGHACEGTERGVAEPGGNAFMRKPKDILGVRGVLIHI